jgi:hypothetical protein
MRKDERSREGKVGRKRRSTLHGVAYKLGKHMLHQKVEEMNIVRFQSFALHGYSKLFV